MEIDCKQHKHGEFSRKLRKFDKVSVWPPDVNLDQQGYKLLTTEDQLAHCQCHFESVLNMTRAVTLDTGVSPCSVPSTALNDEKIIEAIGKLKNGKATGQDGTAAEFLRAGPPQPVDWLIEIIEHKGGLQQYLVKRHALNQIMVFILAHWSEPRFLIGCKDSAKRHRN